jgi:hypothetical protein
VEVAPPDAAQQVAEAVTLVVPRMGAAQVAAQVVVEAVAEAVTDSIAELLSATALPLLKSHLLHLKICLILLLRSDNIQE